MRIAIIGSKGIPANGGGVERHTEELAIRLSKLGHEVFVYARSHYTGTTAKTYRGVHIVYLPAIRTKNLEAITHTLFATLHVLFQHVDIIHYQSVGPSTLAWIPRLLKRKSAVLSTFHCQDKKHEKWSKFAKAYLGFGEYAAATFPHRTIAVSHILETYCEQAFGRKATYIPNGVSIRETSRTDLLRTFGLTPKQYILTVARLVRHKGIHHLIRAYQKLSTDMPLVIVGEGSYTDSYVSELKKLAQGNANIIFTGKQTGEMLAELFSGAAFYVHPSESEGLPITVLEALAYGKATIVSDIPENKEAAGNSTLTFRSGDAEDLKEKLAFLLAHPEVVESMGPAAGERTRTLYDWDRIVKDTVMLYEEALAERKKLPRPIFVAHERGTSSRS